VTAALAALPILLILLLMVGFGWSAARAGSLGAAVALVLALTTFGLGVEVQSVAGRTGAVIGAAAEAAFTTSTILWIVFPALCIYQLQTRGGSIEVLRDSLGRVSADPRILLLLVAWFFALFLEGAAGFGTPVALAAPFLVAAGIDRVEAVVLVLIGHAVGVSFGAIGTPILPQVAVTGFTGIEISRVTGMLHGVLGMLMIGFLLRTDSSSGGPSSSDRKGWRWAFAAGACFLLPYSAIAYWVGPELPTLGGALIGGTIFVLVVRAFGAPPPHRGDPSTAERHHLIRSFFAACAPYLVLVAVILASRLLIPLRELLQEVDLRWTLFDSFSGSVLPLYHPGTMLFIGFAVGALLQRQRPPTVHASMFAAARQLGAVAVALFAMLFLSRTMVHAGMIDAMAAAAGSTLGGAWPVLVPFVGVLGSFVTGSATASNILFTDFQRGTAEALEMPVLPLVGAQGFGASVGNIISPHNVIAGSATVGLSGREGEVLKRTLLPCLAYAGAGGVLIWFQTLG
jgi:lactate permease